MKIYIVSHVPISEELQQGYRVMYVGEPSKTLSDGQNFFSDRGREPHIADKNPFFCELTALQQIALQAADEPDEVFGLVHYRRRFLNRDSYILRSVIKRAQRHEFYDTMTRLGNRNSLNEKTALRLLGSHDTVIVPKRSKFKETNSEFYALKHIANDLTLLRSILSERHADYLKAFDDVMHGTELFVYNMIVTKGRTLAAYSEWLFSILFELEKRIDISERDIYQRRVFGFLSERLLNVYLKKNSSIKIIQLPVWFNPTAGA